MPAKILLLILSGCFRFNADAQINKQLCKPNEEIIFSFQISNKKWVSVCKEKREKYIVYRFGNQNKIELQYPANPDSASWQLFTFKGYSRGGGTQNAAMNIAFLNFSNKDSDYEVFEIWNSEDDKEKCGVTISTGTSNKTVALQGILESRKGYLLSLSDSDKIKLESEN